MTTSGIDQASSVAIRLNLPAMGASSGLFASGLRLPVGGEAS